MGAVPSSGLTAPHALHVIGTPQDAGIAAVPPLVAGRYRLERELGRGGMATVYLAHDERHDAPVAVKVLRPDLSTLVASARFEREVRITARLQHPNILPVLDSGVADGIPFYTMPYVAGETLTTRLATERQLPIADALRIAREIADALAYAHGHGVVHRDIKPSNILLAGFPPKAGATSEWHAMLADFGIARAMDSSSGDRITDSGIAVGTAMYMSPEQSVGDEVDGRSDIYALGCVLYEMLAGTPPFSGSSPQAILARHAVDPVPSLRTVRATVSPALDAVVARSLAKVPADRFTDAAALRDALAAVQREEVHFATGPIPHVTPARRRRAITLAAIATAVVVGAATWATFIRRAPLDANRVMVFPLDGPQADRNATVAEDVATMVGNALDGVGSLRWIDGWREMNPSLRAQGRIDTQVAQRLARARRCAYFVVGRLTSLGGDTVNVSLELYSTADADEHLARSSANVLRTDAWRGGLIAVNGILPRLLGDSTRLDPEWTTRDPGAVAFFLLGESALRRLHPAEALARYRDAIAKDSTFALAALRGAQAASWVHASSDATALVQIALRQRLPERYRFFALGDAAYLEGRADSAARSLRRALALDPEMGAAWAQLAEVYVHLLPARGDVDSLAIDALEHAHAIDPSALGATLHLIEKAVQRGDTSRAVSLGAAFRGARPDSALGAQAELLVGCARGGPQGVDWKGVTRTHPLAALSAAKAFGVEAGATCAKAGFSAVLDAYPRDSTNAAIYRWDALIGLESVLLARGDTLTARQRLDSAMAEHLGGATLFLLGATLSPSMRGRADSIANADVATNGPDFAQRPSTLRLWHLGTWGASERPLLARSVADALLRRISAGGDALDSLYAYSISAQASIANAATAGDTADAERLLEARLVAPTTADVTAWDMAGAHAAERLRLAQARLAAGDARDAMEIARVFDSMSQLSHLLYLPASLELRARAADALRDRTSAQRLRERLGAMTSVR